MTGEVRRSRAHAWVWAVGALVLVSVTGAALVVDRDGPPPRPNVAKPVLAAGWADGGASVSANGVARGSVAVTGAVPANADLAVRLRNATFVTVPSECLVSAARERYSWVSGDGRTLHCVVSESTADVPLTVNFVAVADDGAEGFVTGTASLGATSRKLPDRPVTVGAKPETPDFRLLSSPDFTNADIADLTKGGADFDPATDTNGINDYYRRALDTVLDDWASKKPDDIVVAGDLVEAHWGSDPGGVEMFGPVATHEQRKAAVVRAGNLYYSQWAARFRSHGLTTVHPAIGDHEYGDNDWWFRWKRDLIPTYRDVWAKHFTTKSNGEPKFPVRPRGSVHESTAYAWRPRPDVQMISLDEFTLRDNRMLLEIDQKQQAWLVQVLKKARADGVRWTLVQGHLPILGPVRQGASSGLMYHGGQQSQLWQTFKKYGVDVYLSGEVHDVTAIQRDGVLQISHGGIFQFGRLNYLLADFYPNHLDLKIFDYDFDRVGDDTLWETSTRMPAAISYQPDPGIIGTAQLWRDGRLTRLSGALAPYLP